MKYKLLVIVGIITLFLMSSAVQAAPAAMRFVVNDELKECKTFWSGDEDVRYELPNDWVDYNKELAAHDIYRSLLITDTDYQKLLCNHLGYKYDDVHDLSINNDYGTSIYINDELSSCRIYILDDIYSSEGIVQYKDLTNEGWIKTPSEREFKGPFSGEFVFNRACTKKGYTYTSELKVEGKQIRPYYDETPMFYLAKYFPFILVSIVLLLAAIIIYSKLKK